MEQHETFKFVYSASSLIMQKIKIKLCEELVHVLAVCTFPHIRISWSKRSGAVDSSTMNGFIAAISTLGQLRMVS